MTIIFLVLTIGATAVAAAPKESNRSSNRVSMTAAEPVSSGDDMGEHRVGTSFAYESCGFAPTSSALLTLNGRPGGTETTDGNGCTTTAIAVRSNSQSRIIETSAVVTTSCGTQSAGASGHSPSGAPVGKAVSFRIVCPPAIPAFTTNRVVRWFVAAFGLAGIGVAIAVWIQRRRITLNPASSEETDSVNSRLGKPVTSDKQIATRQEAFVSDD